MSALFADTFYWIALINPKDSAHQSALTIASAESPIVTTDEVLVEYLTYFASYPKQVRSEVAENVREILKNRLITVIPQTHDSFMAGLDLYEQRPDKSYSLTDCISMQTMKQEKLTEVLTNDKHFEQAGFRALFRNPEFSSITPPYKTIS